MDKLKLLN